MKKLKYKNKLFACLMLLSAVCNAKEFRFREIETKYRESLSQYFVKCTVYEIPLTDISNYVMRNADNINFNLSIGDEYFALTLELNDIRGKNFKAVMMTEHDEVELQQTNANTYKGTIDKTESNFVRLTIDNSIFEGYINKNGRRYFIDRLNRYEVNANANIVVVYEASDVKADPNHSCGVSELNEEKQNIDNGKNISDASKLTGPCKFVEIATEADYEYYQAYGSADAALDRIRTILNQVEGLYTGSFHVKFVLVYQQVWTTISDPYAGDSLEVILPQFKNWWANNRTNITRDVTHMFTNQTFLNNHIGLAYTGHVCDNTFYYGCVQNFSPVSNYTINLSAHELGHNFGAHHDASCNGQNIMCAFNQSGAGQWSSLSLTEIPSYIATVSCMDETFSNTATVFGFGPPYSYIKIFAINSININSGFSPVEITNGGFAYFEAGNEIVIAPTNPNTTGFIANTGSVVLMRISDLSNTCLPLAKEADTNYPQLKDVVLSLYPNPANDFITIKINDADSKTVFKIYNSTMQLIKTLNFENGIENKIATGNFGNGIYFIDAQTGDQSYKTKFVISR